MELSNCCNAHVYIDVDYECLICEKCQEPCSLGGKSFKEEDV